MSEQHNNSNIMNLLLHVCCGPCAEWPVEAFTQEGVSITAFFYNPNIHPLVEQTRRCANAKKLMQLKEIPFLADNSYMEDMWKAKKWEESGLSRCQMCYDIRMRTTAFEAKRLGFRAFSTTLLVSPYQNHEEIIVSAQKAEQETGVSFVYRDFRPGYRKGQKMAKEHGIYRQKYCGCISSLMESAYLEKIYNSFPGSDGDTRIVL